MTKRAARAVLVAWVAAAGCQNETGILLSVTTELPGVTRLEYRTAILDDCGRWTQQVGKTVVDIPATRDLRSAPYRVMIVPTAGATDVVLAIDVLAYNSDGEVIGGASAVDQKFSPRAVVEVVRTLDPLSPARWDEPDACVCHDGLPEFAAVGDPACSARVPDDPVRAPSCPIQKVKPVGPRCDGVITDDERPNRELPCYAWLPVNGGKVCAVGRRVCVDSGAIAYQDRCVVDQGSPMIITTSTGAGVGSACEAWEACSLSCGDPIACLAAKPPVATFVVDGTIMDGDFVPCPQPLLAVEVKGVGVLLEGRELPARDAVLLVDSQNPKGDFISAGPFHLAIERFPMGRMSVAVPVMVDNVHGEIRFHTVSACPTPPPVTSDGGVNSPPDLAGSSLPDLDKD